MADLTGILGTMLATGMAGRSRRGPAFSSSPFGMGGSGMGSGLGGGLGGLGGGMGGGGMRSAGMGGGMDIKHVAGLGALGYLAYKAFQERQTNMGSQGGGQGGGASPAGGSSSGGLGDMIGGIFGGGQRGGQGSQAGSGGGLGDRLAGMFGQQRQDTPQPADEPDAYPDVAMEDERALLLIRAMIAAANADGEITADERQRILGKLDEAGAGPDEKRVVERELASPMSTDALVREVRDPATAEQVYLASALAIEPDTQAERSYLQYLAARLNLDPQRAEQLHKVA
ncbi:tellurite resistance TerB family protein [Skermanella mucosa]|uniref:tellurite resistance TerB family protein n=1 Tax=Skermanella mucosa TaxID=1789672 RepID=UPI00192BF5F6|nr:tellurite resistance TerB family protein [Skermanella mucosa]UEM20651.1 tellurite resistance TerB family protein [Skermanella mucosa]